MNKLISLSLLCFLIFAVHTPYAQTVSTAEPPSGFTAENAGNFTLDFVKKFLIRNPLYGNIQNFDIAIDGWDNVQQSNGELFYRVYLMITWDEVSDSISENFYYKGVLMFDKFGCYPMFLVAEQKQPTSPEGGGKRTSELEKEQQNALMELLCPGVKWFYVIDSCLDNK
ncbi:MAG TPA: hypothetical protein PKW37_10160 [Salinivirgaceae bacterium]|nr:hypothetical protein [Salinivirgaceae bacterium]